MHIVIAMAKVGQLGKFSIYVFPPSQHDNNYVKVKTRGGETVGKFRLDIWAWEKNIQLSSVDRSKLEAWVVDNLDTISNKIKEMSGK